MKKQTQSIYSMLTIVLAFFFAVSVACTSAFAAETIKYDAQKHGKLGPLHEGMTAQEVEKAIGKPDKTTKPVFWGATGDYHSDWTFSKVGITLDIVSPTEKSADRTVNRITAKAPCKFKTTLAVGVGSKESYVRKVYTAYEKDAHFSNKNNLVIGSVYGGLMFKFDKGIVTEIFIGASAE
jgi:hypothetical protein